MKKNLILATGIMMFVALSCKKDRTCECTTTGSSTYKDAQGSTTTTNYTPSTTTTTYTKVKKSKLATHCGDMKSTGNYSSSSGTVTTSGSNTSEVKCVIK